VTVSVTCDRERAFCKFFLFFRASTNSKESLGLDEP
jgi:hypothetical protein